MHWTKDCKSKFDIEGKPFQELQAGDPPGPLQQKPERNSIFSLKSSTSSSAAVDILALNNFLLYPQAVPSRIPTGLFGSLPPQTFDLLLGSSSLISKGITVHPGVIDSDYIGEIQIMMSSQILWLFKKGDKIAQLLLLTYISINSSNNVRTGGCGNIDKKQSLWTSLVSEFAQPNINIKLTVKDLLVFSILDLILLLFPNIYGPNPGLYKKFIVKLQGLLRPKYNRFIRALKFIHVRDQKANLQH